MQQCHLKRQQFELTPQKAAVFIIDNQIQQLWFYFLSYVAVSEFYVQLLTTFHANGLNKVLEGPAARGSVCRGYPKGTEY